MEDEKELTEFEKNRENILNLCRVLGYMSIEKNGIVTNWKWNDELKRPIKINNEKQHNNK